MNGTHDDRPVARIAEGVEAVETAEGSRGGVPGAPPRRARATDLFQIPAFRRLWIGTLVSSFGLWSERLAVSWFVFETTGSVLLTGLVATAQYAQNMIFGPVAGAISDRYPRNRIIAAAALAKVCTLLAITGLVRLETPPLVPLFIVITLSAVGGTFTTASLQTLAGDIAGAARRASATSLIWSGQRAVAAVGALASGLLIGWAGASWSLLLSAVMLAVASMIYRGVVDPRTRRSGGGASLIAETLEGLQMVRHQRMLATLLMLAAAAEIFGFSYVALLPALAERVLGVGAFGFGALSGAASVGAVTATVALAALGSRARHGRLLIGVFATFGCLLIGLGASRHYPLSLAIAVGLGACTALVDTLELIMLQAAVDDRLRGRALGAWNAAFGLGWIGPLALGAIADAAGLSVAYTIAGCALLAIGAGTAIAAPRLRSA
ncbi:MAG: MFS transporter [Dehalococcoidia bacterium]